MTDSDRSTKGRSGRFYFAAAVLVAGLLTFSLARGFGPSLGAGGDGPGAPLASGALVTPMPATPIPPGATPGRPIGTVPPAPSVEAGDAEAVRIGGDRPPIETLSDLETYVTNQSTVLRGYAESSPKRTMKAGVTPNRYLSQAEIDVFAGKYNLDMKNVWWEASNGVQGVLAAPLGQTLEAVQADLQKIGDLGPKDYILGGVCFTAVAPASELAALATEVDILLVDVGALPEADAALAAGKTVATFVLPDSVWADYKRLAATSSAPTPTP